MIGRSVFACSLLVPALALASGISPDSRPENRSTDSAVTAELLDNNSTPEVLSCSFAIRATSNSSFDIWVDLYDSAIWGGFGLWAGYNKKLKIQNHRLSPGKSMDRRYTASGSCSNKRKWRFLVRISRTDGRKIYKYVYETTSGSGDRIINLGKSATWGL